MLALPLTKKPDNGRQLVKFVDSEDRFTSCSDGPDEMGEEMSCGFLEVEVHDFRCILFRSVQHPFFDDMFVNLANCGHLAPRQKPGMPVFKAVWIKEQGGCGPVAETQVQLLNGRVFC